MIEYRCHTGAREKGTSWIKMKIKLGGMEGSRVESQSTAG